MTTQEHSPKRLHADDITAIIDGITESLSDHFCRFPSVKPEDMHEVIPFILKFKRLSEKVGSVILVVVVTAITGGCIALMSLGFWRKGGG